MASSFSISLEQIQAIAAGMNAALIGAATAGCDAKATAAVIIEIDRRVELALLQAGCPPEEVEEWMLTIAKAGQDRSLGTVLRDMPPEGSA